MRAISYRSYLHSRLASRAHGCQFIVVECMLNNAKCTGSSHVGIPAAAAAIHPQIGLGGIFRRKIWIEFTMPLENIKALTWASDSLGFLWSF